MLEKNKGGLDTHSVGLWETGQVVQRREWVSKF